MTADPGCMSLADLGRAIKNKATLANTCAVILIVYGMVYFGVHQWAPAILTPSMGATIQAVSAIGTDIFLACAIVAYITTPMKTI